MGDVLAAYRDKQGKREQTTPRVTWWDYRQNHGLPLTNMPLSSRLTAKQWKTSDRIHDAFLPLTTNQKPYIVLSHEDFVEKRL
ncbi:hypothetical protein EDD86DRAFT_197772 [Gorgonomyces haynaldii]|nr:hypothetical protein EDD86DRAFT_197772 [Gorgonomyces haynaldii]